MAKERGISSKTAFWLFILLAGYVFIQTVWWIVLMARLVDEKVDLAMELGADQTVIDRIVAEEIRRQVMLGLEGLVFLFLIVFGAWLIYRALIKTRELTFHQQNFLMAVTHELKTPLASIKIYLDSLESTKITEEKKLSILPRMKSDLSRLEKLVENILDAGRFERSGYRLNKSTFDFSTTLHDILNETEALPLSKTVLIRRKIQDGVQFYGDRPALCRAISAVIENATKYHDKDTIEIEVELTKSDGLVTLKISDNGVGLDWRDIRNVFNRFYRVGQELQRNHSGSGLGLYLCREIIRAHEGEIVAESDGLGKGTTFTFRMKAQINENDTAR